MFLTELVKAQAKTTKLNIKNLGNDSYQSVDFPNMKGWENVEEEVLVINHSGRNANILQTKSAELEKWQKHRAYVKKLMILGRQQLLLEGL